jgi:hypothetical protein
VSTTLNKNKNKNILKTKINIKNKFFKKAKCQRKVEVKKHVYKIHVTYNI